MIPALGRLLKNYLWSTPVEAQKAAEDLRGKALYAEMQRCLKIYLRALWDCDFVMRQAAFDPEADEEDRPFIEYGQINLPEVFYDSEAATAREIYRAAAAHAAAHLIYVHKHFSKRSLNKWQMDVISAIEDARVETLAVRRFPGLKPLWAAQHVATPADTLCRGDYLNRLARALLDEAYQDGDAWVEQGRAWFHALDDLEREYVSRELGLKLADAFRTKGLRYHPGTDTQSALYRDDNRALWRRATRPLEIFNPYFRSKSSIGVEEGNKRQKNKQAQAFVEAEDDRPQFGTFVYPEWNYRSRSEDASWVTLRERDPPPGDLAVINTIIAANGPLIARTKSLLRAIREGAIHRVRKLEDGDELDINAAIRAHTAMRLGRQPDARIMMRMAHRTRDISVLVLLDLSRSMNERVKGREHTALQLTQQVCVLFAEAISAVGDPYAIHGFFSDSRHFVEYFRFKDFGQVYDDGVKARIAGMQGKRGTRMGAAVRHATHYLNEQKSGKKILLIITDGEPSDVDAPDRRYLHDDTKKSVEDARRCGIHSYCITLDPAADQYVARIFGAMNYMVVDHIKHLPEKVLLIYAGLTRQAR
jgi:nitric oxide reductase NorD protein